MVTQPGPNLIVLSVDSLTKSGFDEYMSDILDELDAVSFSNAYATASNTNSSVPTLAAGVYSDFSEDVGLPGSGSPTTFAEALSDAGYKCALWTDNFLFGREYNYDRGFEGGNVGSISWKRRIAGILDDQPIDTLYDIGEWTYFHVLSPLLEQTNESGSFWKPASKFHATAIDWLNQNQDLPTLSWIHYMDVHHPYDAPSEYINKATFNTPRSVGELGRFTRDAARTDGEGLSEADLEDVKMAYDCTCEYLGDEILEFIRALKQEGHFNEDRDILCITADHGESFPPKEHDQLGHKSLWEETIHVPLVIAAPDWDSKVVNEQVSLIDLMPTLLSLAGVTPPDSAVGNACEDPSEMERNKVYTCNAQPWFKTCRGIRTADGWKYFGHMDSDREYHYYLTRSVGSPKRDEILYTTPENTNQPPDGQIQQSKWDSLADDLRSSLGPAITESASFELTDQVEEHLEDLGYVE
ncbi:sulfatase-like hydrolase/transferase [Halosimplex halobium]|uniref:sulfatase-like hydrolase/transferase n=1 Tax=Halosimplex halobium TaxID=3396618 RepID=UPI003F5660B7